MLFVLFFTAFNLFLGFSIVFPIFPIFVKELNGRAFDVGLLVSIQPLMQFIFSPMWGKLSDKYGRKKFIVIGMIGFAISYYLTAIANSIGFLYFARVLGGILSSAAIPSVNAYASDISTEKDRNVALGIVGSGFGFGLLVGPFVGGVIGNFDIRLVFYSSFFIFLINALLAQIVLKELKGNYNSVKVHFKNKINSYVIFGSFLNFFVLLCSTTMQVILGILLSYKFNLDAFAIGTLISIGGFFGAISQLNLKFLLNYFSEKSLIVIGLFLLGITTTIVSFINETKLFYFLMAIYGISFGIVQPNLMARISKRVPSEYQGSFMGIFQSLGSLGRFLGPIAGAFLYQINPSLPYIIAGLILIILSIISIIWI